MDYKFFMDSSLFLFRMIESIVAEMKADLVSIFLRTKDLYGFIAANK